MEPIAVSVRSQAAVSLIREFVLLPLPPPRFRALAHCASATGIDPITITAAAAKPSNAFEKPFISSYLLD
jgi:hypothetical protein